MLQAKPLKAGRLMGAVYDFPEPSDVLDWRSGNPHAFVALDAGARLVNIVKGRGAAGTDAVQAFA